MPPVAFTPRELDVMTALWDHGPSTVAEVRATLARTSAPLAYTTVLTVLRTLEAKGRVAHALEGRAHRYRPLVERETARRSALHRLLGSVFGGSPELLLTQLVDEAGLSADELLRMRALLDHRLREQDATRGTISSPEGPGKDGTP